MLQKSKVTLKTFKMMQYLLIFFCWRAQSQTAESTRDKNTQYILFYSLLNHICTSKNEDLFVKLRRRNSISAFCFYQQNIFALHSVFKCRCVFKGTLDTKIPYPLL